MPKEVITSKGSVYRYLPDGRTQRFKTATGELEAPQDLLVFVPDFDWIVKNAPPEYKTLLGENEVQYEQVLLSYTRTHGKKCYVVDGAGKILGSNADVARTKPVFVTFGDDSKVDFHLPVSAEPRLGYYTFDTRVFQEGQERMRERHLGNKVVEIR